MEVSDLAYVEQRNRMREAREHCLDRIAAALGCEVEQLPREVERAVTLLGHECYKVALEYGDDVHERITSPAPPKDGTYREAPTRVDRPYRRR